MENRNKYGEPFSNGVGEIFIQQVMDRWDIKETPTGRPRKLRCAYIDWKRSYYHGGILEKRDLKELRKWIDWQIEHFDDADKEVMEI